MTTTKCSIEFFVVSVDQNYDYVEGLEFISHHPTDDEAMAAKKKLEDDWYQLLHKRNEYIKSFVEAIELPDTDYQGWIEFLKKFDTFGHRYTMPKDFKKDFLSHLTNTHNGYSTTYGGYSPPPCPSRPNLYIMEVKTPMSEFSFDEYQKQSRTTARYPDIGNNYVYPVLGLCGEAGEVSEKIKKLLRDKGGVIDDAFREAAKKELGDVLWYHAQLCSEFGFSMSDVAKGNLDKLFGRVERGTIHGSGDNR